MNSQQPLRHAYPSWETPEGEPYEELHEVWRGNMRIVRNKRRAKRLQRRGVPMLKTSTSKCWLWFTESNEVAA